MFALAQPAFSNCRLLRLQRFVRQPIALSAIIFLWALFVLGGLAAMMKEEFTPVAGSNWMTSFPAATAIRLAPDRPTLVVFAHPHCPCTRATMREVSQIMATVKDGVSVEIVFTVPPGMAKGWEQGELLRMAEDLLGGKVIIDRGGEEAGRFRAVGSGTALLYSPAGQLLFSGGVTDSRGHDGESVGGDAIISLVTRGTSAVSRAPVYGYALL